MKKNKVGPLTRFGPLPTPNPRLSAARASILHRVLEADDWLSIADLRNSSGLHGNTVREHLDALVTLKMVRRKRADAQGRGRPAWLYATEPHGPSAGGEYANLATALAGQLSLTSSDPAADAVGAGLNWGRKLGADEKADGALDTRRRVVTILDELGFDPDPDDDCKNIKLRHCPLLDAARVHPDVVCGVHDGIVRGALESLGADPAQSELRAFHEPGACHLQLHE